MRPRRRLTGAAVLAALLGLLLAPMPSAQAAVPSEHAYWWRLQTGNGPALRPPPFVPDGGLWVSNDAIGQQAISAVRYTAPRGTEIRRLDLRVAQSTGSGALMLACAARDDWDSVQAGRWNTRPATRCDVAFVRGTASGGVWSFDVRGLGRSGTLDVVILPPPGLNESFSVAFQRPDASTVVTEQLPGSPSPTTSATNGGGGTTSPTGRPRATPSVLGTQTTQPGSPTVSQPVPSFGSPSGSVDGGPRALAPSPEGRRPGRGWLYGVAAVLAMSVLGARAFLPRYRRPPA
jgi:hypothetical protein